MDRVPPRRAPLQVRCPTCGQRFFAEETPVMPFCSRRCQQIDLGRWFNEEIGLPVEPGDFEEDVDQDFDD